MAPQTPAKSIRDKSDVPPATPEDNDETYSTLGASNIISPQGRVRRPQSVAAGRRRSSNGLTPPRNTSSSGSPGQDTDYGRRSSLADRLARSPSPSRILEQTELAEEDNETERSSRRSSGAQSRSSNIHSDLQDIQEDHTDGEDRGEKKEKRITVDEKLRFENESLRIAKSECEKQIIYLENQCEVRDKKIQGLEDSQEESEQAVARFQREIAEFKNVRDDCQLRINELEEEVEGLRPLKDVEAEMKKVEEQAADQYNKLEVKKVEIAELRVENEGLKVSRHPLEKALREIEQERDNLVTDMNKVQEWMEKMHEQQMKRDLDQFKECDDQVLELMTRKLDQNYRNSLPSTEGQQENLGDVIHSRPQSFSTSYSLNSRPISMASQQSDPFAVRASPRSHMAMIQSPSYNVEDAAPPQRKVSSQVTFAELQQDLRSPLQTIPGFRGSVPNKHRSFRRRNAPRKSSRLRHYSVPAQSRSGESPRKSGDSISIASLDIAEMGAGGRRRPRRFSAPLTEQEHEELCEYLKSRYPVPLSWETVQSKAVFEHDPARALEQSHEAMSTDDLSTSSTEQQTNGSSISDAAGEHGRRQDVKRPAPILTALDTSASHCLKNSEHGSPEFVRAGPFTPPSTRASESSSGAGEAKAVSSSFEPPPSPSPVKRRKRGGDFASVTATGSPIAKSRDLSESPNAAARYTPVKSPRTKIPPSPRIAHSPGSNPTPSKVALPASDDESEELQGVVGTTFGLPGQTSPPRRRKSTSPNLSLSSSPTSSHALLPDKVVPAVQGQANAAEVAAHQAKHATDKAKKPDPIFKRFGEYLGQRVGVTGADSSEADRVSSTQSRRRTQSRSHSWNGLVQAGRRFPSFSDLRQNQSLVLKLMLLMMCFVSLLTTLFVMYTKFAASNLTTPFWTPAASSVHALTCPPCQKGSEVLLYEPCRPKTDFHTETVTETGPIWVTSNLACPVCEMSSEIPVCEPCMASTDFHTKTFTVATPAWMTSTLVKTLSPIAPKTATETETRNVTVTEIIPAWTTSILTSFERITATETQDHIVFETKTRVETEQQTVTLTLSPPESKPQFSTITKTLTATEREVLNQTSTVTSTLVLATTVLTTLIKREVETVTATSNRTIISVSTSMVTVPKPSTRSWALPSFELPAPPPSRSFTGAHLPSFSLNNPLLSLPRPVPIPGIIPATHIPFSPRECDCACPTSPSPSRSTPLSAAQLDERAARAKRRNAQQERLSQGPTYLGLVPGVRMWRDVLDMKVHEWVMGPVWGSRVY